MSVIIENKFCFVHIPRTAGTSVVHWLEENSINHVRDSSHPSIHMLNSNFETSIACVRNPWERMVSMYAHLKKPGFLWETMHIKDESQLPSWDEFLKTPSQKIFWFDSFTNQSDWIPGGVDILLRYENLVDDFRQVQALLECHKPLPHVNGSSHNTYRSYYNTSQSKQVAEIFSKDIDTFKYSF